MHALQSCLLRKIDAVQGSVSPKLICRVHQNACIYFCRNWWPDFLNIFFLYFTALSLIWGMWKLHCVTQDLLLQCTHTPVVMPSLGSCSTACRILVPWPEIEAMSPALWGRFFFKRFICLFVYVILAGLGLCCCTHGIFLFVVSGGYALVAADKLPIAMTSVMEHRL